MRRSCTALLALFCFASCARWPSLEPIRFERAASHDAFLAASTILVGRVASMDSGPRGLQRLQVDVENVVQGGPIGGTASIFCYLDPDAALRRSARYVFFLVRDRGILRAVWDYRPSALPVESGDHRGFPLPTRRPSELVSALLLTPGSNMNPEAFLRAFPDSVLFALSHIGRWRTAKLLKLLSHDSPPPVRRAACTQLTARFWGQDSCWDQLDGAPPPGAAVSRALEQAQRSLTADPNRWWKRMSARFPPDELLDELRLLTSHKDPQIRARYCRFLRSHYPGENDCGCNSQVVGEREI